MTNALVPVSDIERMAKAISGSNLFGIKTADQAMALMLIAQAEGLHPAIAARDYHIISGKPSLKADAMLARFHTAGGKVVWHEYTDSKCSATISHPQGGSVTVDWTIDMARDIGLTKNPTWKSYPRQMLRSRVISEGIRTVYPGVAVGVYTPEEVQDFSPEADSKTIEGDIVVENGPVKTASPFKTAAARKTFCANVAQSFHDALTPAELETLRELNKPKFEEMRASGNEHDSLAVEELSKQYKIAKARLTLPQEPTFVDGEFDDRADYPGEAA